MLSVSHGWRIAGTAVTLLFSSAGSAAPFPARDLNPLLAGFGVPAPMPARMQAPTWSVAADVNWASTALAQRAGPERLVVDAETREARVTIGRSWSDRLITQLQIPYRYTGGGVLDSAIDSWHDAFSLPEGERAQQPADQIRIAYERNGTVLLDIDSSARGLADMSLDLGYALTATETSAAAAWLSIKVPSGDAERLTGSGAMDISLAIAGEHRLGSDWSVFAQAGVSWLGEGDRLAAQQREIAWSAMGGVGWRVWRGLELKAQLDAHSAVFAQSELDFLSGALVLTVGGDYRFQSGWQLDMAVSEDVAVESASDVVFVIGLRRGL
jgi:hypothetical protein